MAFSDFEERQIVAQIQGFLQLNRAADPDFLNGTELGVINGQRDQATNTAIDAWIKQEGLSGALNTDAPGGLERLYAAMQTSLAGNPALKDRLRNMAVAATRDPAYLEEKAVLLNEEEQRRKKHLQSASTNPDAKEAEEERREAELQLRRTQEQMREAEEQYNLAEEMADPVMRAMLRAGAALGGFGGDVLVDADAEQAATALAAKDMEDQSTAFSALGMNANDPLSETQIKVGNYAYEFLKSNGLPAGESVIGESVDSVGDFNLLRSMIATSGLRLSEKAAEMESSPDLAKDEEKVLQLQAALGIYNPEYAARLDGTFGDADIGSPTRSNIAKIIKAHPTVAAKQQELATAAAAQQQADADRKLGQTQQAAAARTPEQEKAAGDPAQQARLTKAVETPARQRPPESDNYHIWFMSNIVLNSGKYDVHAQNVWQMMRQSNETDPQKKAGLAIDEYLEKYVARQKELHRDKSIRQWKADHNGEEPPPAELDKLMEQFQAGDLEAMREKLITDIVELRKEDEKWKGIQPTAEELADNFVENAILPDMAKTMSYEMSNGVAAIYRNMKANSVDFNDPNAFDAAFTGEANRYLEKAGGFGPGNERQAMFDSLREKVQSVHEARTAVLNYENIQPKPEDAVRLMRESWDKVIPQMPALKEKGLTAEHYEGLLKEKIAFYQTADGGFLDPLTAAARAGVDIRAQMDTDNGVPARAVVDENHGYYQSDIFQMGEWMRGRLYVEQQIASGAAESRLDATKALNSFGYPIMRQTNIEQTAENIYKDMHPEAAHEQIMDQAAQLTGPAPAPDGASSAEIGQQQLDLAQEIIKTNIDPLKAMAPIDLGMLGTIVPGQVVTDLLKAQNIDVSTPEALVESMRRHPDPKAALDAVSQNPVVQFAPDGLMEKLIPQISASIDQFKSLETQRQAVIEAENQPAAAQAAKPAEGETATAATDQPAETPAITPEQAAAARAALMGAASLPPGVVVKPPEQTAAPAERQTEPAAEQTEQTTHPIDPFPGVKDADGQTLTTDGQTVTTGTAIADANTNGQITLEQAVLAYHALIGDDVSGGLSAENKEKLEPIGKEVGVAAGQAGSYQFAANDWRLLAGVSAYANNTSVDELPPDWQASFQQISKEIKVTPNEAKDEGLTGAFQAETTGRPDPALAAEPTARDLETDAVRQAEPAPAAQQRPDRYDEDVTARFSDTQILYADLVGSLQTMGMIGDPNHAQFIQELQNRYGAADEAFSNRDADLTLYNSHSLTAYVNDYLNANPGILPAYQEQFAAQNAALEKLAGDNGVKLDGTAPEPKPETLPKPEPSWRNLWGFSQ